MPWLIIGVVIFMLIYGLSQIHILKSTRREFGFLGNEEDAIKYILALAAYMAKTDNVVGSIEKKHIEDSIKHDFKEKYSAAYIAQFNRYLKLDINLKKVCHSLRRDNSISSIIHLLHFLVGIVAVDGVLTRDEEHKLFAIARNLRIPSASLRAIIAMYNMQRESERKSESNNNTHKRSSSDLATAYTILGLQATVSDEKLKRTYRKLAKLHHPDKFAHLGKVHQAKATLKFQKIADAYTLIKKSRNLA